MFQEPNPTDFDLRFRLFGVPVRVHPLFWLLTFLLAGSTRDGRTVLTWVACVFLSILVHEFGHALSARYFGAEPRVWLYALGGLAVYDGDRQSPRRRLAVLAMGPGAGFLLFGALLVVVYLWLGMSPAEVWSGDFDNARSDPSVQAKQVIRFLTYINVYWGLVNLLPIMPLDGGQIATILLSWQNRREGARRGYILSLMTAGLATIYLLKIQSYATALMAGWLAVMSFQMLQVLHYRSRYGSFEDDADWWKR